MFECVCPHDYFGDLCQTNTDFCSINPCINGLCHVRCKLVEIHTVMLIFLTYRIWMMDIAVTVILATLESTVVMK